VTIHARVADARRRLRAAGIPGAEADLDARLLAEHVLGWDAARFITDGGAHEPAAFAPAFDALVARRTAREPVAYILGRREFWGLDFEVSRDVLIPRPETELVVQGALDAFPDPHAAVRIADVGTGSGCLAVVLARERPNASVVATDVSRRALEIARRNAIRHGVSDRITFAETNLLDAVEPGVDLIVSNPPYVPERDRAALQPEIRDYEPGLALFAGDDGLAAIRSLTAQAADRLSAEGLLMFEFGANQAGVVMDLVGATEGLRLVEVRSDLQGIPRAAICRRA
jgi:release factor glutamine methyltransferase